MRWGTYCSAFLQQRQYHQRNRGCTRGMVPGLIQTDQNQEQGTTRPDTSNTQGQPRISTACKYGGLGVEIEVNVVPNGAEASCWQHSSDPQKLLPDSSLNPREVRRNPRHNAPTSRRRSNARHMRPHGDTRGDYPVG